MVSKMRKQKGRLWYRTVSSYAVGAVIWMILLGLLFLYFWLGAPDELWQEKHGRSSPERVGRQFNIVLTNPGGEPQQMMLGRAVSVGRG
jgi:hypothetical protein